MERPKWIDCIFCILQHFATKICNFTNFRMLFNCVVMNFTIISIFLEILSIMQSVHCQEPAVTNNVEGFMNKKKFINDDFLPQFSYFLP